MELSSGLALKALGGLAVASTVVTVGVVKKDSIASALGLNKVEVDLKTEADKKLIEYIKKDDQDIVFKVIKGDSGTTDLTKDDLALESTADPKTILVKVEVKTSNEGQFKIKNNGTKTPTIESLKQLNTDNVDWNWECKIKLTTVDTISSKTELSIKDKLLKNGGTNEGFFDILKKDSTTETGNDSVQKIKKIKATKIKFIENCASAEGNTTKPRTFNSNTLAAEQTFQLKLGKADATWGTETNKLFFENKTKFNKWFGEIKVNK